MPLVTFECVNLFSAGTGSHALLVDKLLEVELSKGFVIGPFVSSPFSMWRVSPIGVMKGKCSNKYCLINDLSAPYSSHIPSLNSH